MARWLRRRRRPGAPLRGAALCVAGAAVALADVYMHNPRGSNNKLNEESNNVRTDTRLYNSQNNDNGGYQVGDACEPNCRMGGPDQNRYEPDRRGAAEGQLAYFAGSVLAIEWTQQHACGGNRKSHCQLVLQYMCGDTVRDGYTTDRIPESPDSVDNLTYGMHEDWGYYEKCLKRERNRGLYIADRNLGGSRDRRHSAEATRQNNNPSSNNRRGFECQEERDYYPYWHPTPWRDIAVLTMDTARCKWYRAESENVKGRGECLTRDLSALDPGDLPNNRRDCERAGYSWVEHEPHTGEDGLPLPPPECREPPWGRDNHLGNSKNGYASTYNWTIPADLVNAGNCVLRLRYNISTGDYDPTGAGASWEGDWNVDSGLNGKDEAYITNNPFADYIGYTLLRQKDPGVGDDVVGDGAVLRLAVNTAQVGRTFQDRSHSFRVLPRPAGLPKSAKIHNLNVRGRRGNIVQVYPSVEYDFVPEHLVAAEGDYVHFQWQHSDANANNAGEGKQRTDRSNVVQVRARGEHPNTPAAYEQGLPLFAHEDGSPDHVRIAYFAHLGQEGCEYDTSRVNPNSENSNRNCAILNRAPATVNAGLVCLVNPGRHHIMSTRNNNFSNRSQKGIIEVLQAWFALPASERGNAAAIGWVALVVFATAAIAALLALGSWMRANPHRPWTQYWLAKKLCRVPDAADCVRPGTYVVHLPQPEQGGRHDTDRVAEAVAKAAGVPAANVHPLGYIAAVDDVPAQCRVWVDSRSALPTTREVEAAVAAAGLSVLCVERPDPDTGVESSAQRAGHYNRRWFLTVVAAQGALWVWGFVKHRQVLLRHGNAYLPVAKGSGNALNLLLPLTVLPLMRNLIGFLRTTPVRDFVDLDAAVDTHKRLAWLSLAHMGLHVVAHVGNTEFYRVRFCDPPYCEEDCTCADGPWGQTWGGMLRSVAGWTGVVLAIFFAAIFVGAREGSRCAPAGAKSRCPVAALARRLPEHGGWDLFWYTHHLWIPCFLLMLLHAPYFHAWVAFPALFFLVEKAIEYSRLVQNTSLTGAVLVSKDVVQLRIAKEGFRWRCGQYVRLKVSSLSPFVSHPFTISSAPEQDFLGVHIRASPDQDWTRQLRQQLEALPRACKEPVAGASAAFPIELDVSRCRLSVAVDGPYAAPTQEFCDFDTVLLVGAGIGVTPFAAIIKSMHIRRMRGLPAGAAAGHGVDHIPSACYFYWLVNSESHFTWFSDLMNEVQQAAADGELAHVCDFQTYMTGDFDLEDYARRHQQGRLPWKIQRTGRPDWRRVVQDIRQRHQGTVLRPHRVGVFLCGPDGIAATLARECRAAECDTVSFTFLKEHF